MWGMVHDFPRAILHIDGDGFFAACEVAKDPSLRGKPVITGKERGIVSACTYEAKARGITRGMILSQVREICPEAVILPSDYETYSLFSQRMYEIVRRFTPAVEEYSIDECFADLTGLRRMPARTTGVVRSGGHHARYPDIALTIKRALELELGMTFSLGLSATKVLAKVGSKWKKPSGFTQIPLREAHIFLAKTPTEKLWGIGSNTAAYLRAHGIHTALQFARREEAWVRASVSKPFFELWRELNGEVVFELDTKGREGYRSIQKTKTFTPPSRDAAFIFAQLSKNIENACIKARRWGLAAPEAVFFLKTQDFKYHACAVKLPYPTAIPQDVLRLAREHFSRMYRSGVLYRASGVTLMKLSRNYPAQLDLFGGVERSEGMKKIFDSIDAVSERYGKHAVFLGSSFKAMVGRARAGARNESPERHRNLFKGETARRRLGMPFLGEVG